MKTTKTFLNLFIALIIVTATRTSLAECRLCTSSHKGDIATVKRLLADGADPNGITDYGNTALISAAGRGHIAIVKILLDAGTKVNTQGHKGITALMNGTSGGNPAIIKMLLESGANPNLTDEFGATALMWGSGKNIKNIKELILYFQQYGHLRKIEKRKTEKRLDSVQTTLPDTIKMLLDAGADPHVSDKSGWTALMYAAKAGSANVTHLLIKQGVDVNAANADGWTALDIAEEVGDRGIVRILRKAGAE